MPKSSDSSCENGFEAHSCPINTRIEKQSLAPTGGIAEGCSEIGKSGTGEEDASYSKPRKSASISNAGRAGSWKEMRKLPLYEYECQKCGELTEILQSLAEADKGIECPECGSSEMRRKFSTFGVIMGSGKASSTESAASCPTGTCSLPPMS
jgi:putative FmdB family regulatory protein